MKKKRVKGGGGGWGGGGFCCLGLLLLRRPSGRDAARAQPRPRLRAESTTPSSSWLHTKRGLLGGQEQAGASVGASVSAYLGVSLIISHTAVGVSLDVGVSLVGCGVRAVESAPPPQLRWRLGREGWGGTGGRPSGCRSPAGKSLPCTRLRRHCRCCRRQGSHISGFGPRRRGASTGAFS